MIRLINSLALILLIFSLIDCTNSQKSSESTVKQSCLDSIFYDSRQGTFNAALIKLFIVDADMTIINSAKSKSLKNILFFSIPKADRRYFQKAEYFEIKNDTIILGVLSNYFKADTVKQWDFQDIEVLLGKDIGLVITNDTIHVERCN